MSKKNRKPPWHQYFLIAMAILLSLLMVVSRAYRASRRAGIAHSETPAVFEQAVSGVPDTEERSEIYEPMYPLPEKLALLGHIDPVSDDGFTLIDRRYANRQGMYMRSEAYDAFLQMHKAAQSDGINLIILSATRPFDHQKRIWEDKWFGRRVLYGNILATDIDDLAERAREILRFSAMPGTSRHHWGTDIDLNSLDNSYFASGEGKAVYDWLIKNAAGFGFCQPYTAHGDNREGGYEEEKWHWSYQPISSVFLKAYEDMVDYGDITGFAGWEMASELDVISRYVLDISLSCY